MTFCCTLPARAQEVDCATLVTQRDTLASASRNDAQWASAATRQKAEIDRTRAYGDSLGCGEGLLSAAFGSPRCAAIAERLARMEGNLDQLNARSGAAQEDDGALRALSDQLARFCGGNAPGADQGLAQDGTRLLPVDPGGPAVDIGAGGGEAPTARPPGRALCVRRCDGGFFPIADRVAPDRFEGLGRLCKALCPNTEADLYTTSDPSGDLATAVSADGSPYTALPAAFKYLRTYDATCSCKPADQSWAQALAEAESLLQADTHDVIVTQKLSDVMARPAGAGGAMVVDRAAAPTGPPAKPRRRAREAGGSPRTAPASPVPDPGREF